MARLWLPPGGGGGGRWHRRSRRGRGSDAPRGGGGEEARGAPGPPADARLLRRAAPSAARPAPSAPSMLNGTALEAGERRAGASALSRAPCPGRCACRRASVCARACALVLEIGLRRGAATHAASPRPSSAGRTRRSTQVGAEVTVSLGREQSAARSVRSDPRTAAGRLLLGRRGDSGSGSPRGAFVHPEPRAAVSAGAVGTDPGGPGAPPQTSGRGAAPESRPPPLERSPRAGGQGRAGSGRRARRGCAVRGAARAPLRAAGTPAHAPRGPRPSRWGGAREAAPVSVCHLRWWARLAHRDPSVPRPEEKPGASWPSAPRPPGSARRPGLGGAALRAPFPAPGRH